MNESLKFRPIRKKANMIRVKFHLHITIRTSDIIFLRITVRLTYCMTCLHRIFGHFEGIQFHSAPRISSRTIFSKGAIKINFYLKYWSTEFYVRYKFQSFSNYEISPRPFYFNFLNFNVQEGRLLFIYFKKS